MEELNTIWQVIAPYVTGISISGVLGAVIFACLKGAFQRTINKINVEKISEKATEKGITKIREVSFKQSIQPLVESELKKITEMASQVSSEALTKIQEKYNQIIIILEKLATYFDNSIGVSESAKKDLHEAINVAKEEIVPKEVEVKLVETEDKKPVETVKVDVKKTENKSNVLL